LRDIDEPSQAHVPITGRVLVVEVAVVIERCGEQETWITTSVDKCVALTVLAGLVPEAVLVPDQVRVDVAAKLVDCLDHGLESGFAAVESVVVSRAEVEPVVNVVAHRLVARVGPARRRKVDGAIAGVEEVRGALLDSLIGTLKPLQDDRRGGVR